MKASCSRTRNQAVQRVVTPMVVHAVHSILRAWGRVGDMSGAMFRTLNSPIVGVSLKTILATVADAAKDVDATVQQQAYEWAKRMAREGDPEGLMWAAFMLISPWIKEDREPAAPATSDARGARAEDGAKSVE